MRRFETLHAIAIPFAEPNLDTDQILPARYLSRPRVLGYGEACLNDRRFLPDGSTRPGSILDLPIYRGAAILVGGANFGCGSSREGAVYALQDFGIGAVLAPAFADIFAGNAAKNGLLCAEMDAADIARLAAMLAAVPGSRLTVDLAAQAVTTPDGQALPFRIDPFRRRCLLDGVDELDVTLSLDARIAAFEQAGIPAGIPVRSHHEPSNKTSKEESHVHPREGPREGAATA